MEGTMLIDVCMVIEDVPFSSLLELTSNDGTGIGGIGGVMLNEVCMDMEDDPFSSDGRGRLGSVGMGGGPCKTIPRGVMSPTS